MKVELFPFQKTALARLRQSVATALGNYRSTHTPQVVSYTAPTGAGKTIVMSALIEAIYYGDELYPDQSDAIFIWLSDSPQLNEQSRLKIDLKADSITGGGLHGKDLSKADVSVNIYAWLKAQRDEVPVELCCAIGDDTVDGRPYAEIVKIARDYIRQVGGFERFAEWGLV